MCNAQNRFNRHFGKKHSAVCRIGHHLNDVVFFHIFNAGNGFFGYRCLLEGFLVHENIVSPILIKKLIGATLYANILQFKSYLKRTVKYTARRYIFQLGAHNSISLARFNVLKVDTSENLVVKTNARPDFDFL